MEQPRYFKAVCAHCGNNIEFPETAVGLMVDCPHCGQRTQLRAIKKASAAEPDAPATPIAPLLKEEGPADQPARANSMMAIAIAIASFGLIAAIAGGVLFWKARHAQPTNQPMATAKPLGTKTNTPALVAPVAAEVSSASAAVDTPATNPPAASAKTKQHSDLTVGEIQLEKANGSSLVYAVGQLDNHSDFQRFGVTIKLNVFNRAGKKLGTAQDYVQVIEPRKSWRFRALLTDSKAADAKLASITEDE